MFWKDIEFTETQLAQTVFDLRDILGKWISREGAPSLCILYTIKGYNIQLKYNSHSFFQRPIHVRGNMRFFDLYGKVGLAYNPEQDILYLSAYGEYRRPEDLEITKK